MRINGRVTKTVEKGKPGVDDGRRSLLEAAERRRRRRGGAVWERNGKGKDTNKKTKKPSRFLTQPLLPLSAKLSPFANLSRVHIQNKYSLLSMRVLHPLG